MNDCIFCRIVQKKMPAAVEYESKNIVCFRDVNPQAPVHLLIVPVAHIEKVDQLDQKHGQLMGEMILTAKELARKMHIADGYRLVINNGESAGQSVFHIHLHLLGGRLMSWPPG